MSSPKPSGGRPAAIRPILYTCLAAFTIGVAFWLAARYQLITEYKLSEAAHHRHTEPQVTVAEARADVAFMAELLPKVYGGSFELDDSEWQQTFDQLDQRIATWPKPVITAEEFAQAIAKAFEVFVDGHLLAAIKSDTYKAFPAKPRLLPYRVTEGCAESVRRDYQKQGFEERDYFDRAAKSEGSLQRKTALIGLKPRYDTLPDCLEPIAKGRQLSEVKIHPPGKDWQYIRIGSSYSKAYYTEFKDAADKVGRGRNLVFDLRGHGGGDNSLDFKLIGDLGLPFRNPYDGRIVHTTPAAIQLQWNSVKWNLSQFNPQLAEDRMAWHDRKLWRHFFGLEKNRQRFKSGSYPNKPIDQRFARQIVVIMDGYCMSACESLVKVLRDYPKTTVIGTNTSGGVKIGDVATAILPHSQLRLEVGRALNTAFSDSMGYREKTGFIPDIWMATADLSQEEAIAIAAKVIAWKQVQGH